MPTFYYVGLGFMLCFFIIGYVSGYQNGKREALGLEVEERAGE